MTRVIIVHGFKGKPNTNWKPWLKNELEMRGASVEVPEMPNTDNPIATEWVSTLAEVVETANEDTYLVGHSLGCITILRYLEGLAPGQKVGGAVFVAGFAGKFDKYGGGHDSFLEHELNWDIINSHCDSFVAIHSRDDLNVEFNQLGILKEKLNAKAVAVNGMGHFGSADGVFQVPIVAQELNMLMI